MKISVSDGTISFPDGDINPTQGRTKFLNTSIGLAAKQKVVNDDWVHIDIEPEPGISGLIICKGERLIRVLLLMTIPSDASDQWSTELELERKAKHDAWLGAELGAPPYEYPWGRIASEFDQRGYVSEIIVNYAS
ncbi:MAG: hypothetical protein ACRES3_04325 [Steroidobacteraceae bacterium]